MFFHIRVLKFATKNALLKIVYSCAYGSVPPCVNVVRKCKYILLQEEVDVFASECLTGHANREWHPLRIRSVQRRWMPGHEME